MLKIYEQAIEDFEKAYKLDKTNLVALRKQAHCEGHCQLWKQAEKHYRLYFDAEKYDDNYTYFPDYIRPLLHMGYVDKAHIINEEYLRLLERNR